MFRKSIAHFYYRVLVGMATDDNYFNRQFFIIGVCVSSACLRFLNSRLHQFAHGKDNCLTYLWF